MIDAAIVGLGRWGQLLVQSVQGKSDKIRFAAGVTRTVSKAEAFCREHDIPLGSDYDAVLADPAIDAVVLATPHTLHFDQTMAAAKAGKHVFCEKPFTLNTAAAKTALEALRGAGLAVGVGHNRRFSPNLIEMKRMIDAGELGELIHAEGNFSANMSRYADEWRTDRTESPAGGMTSLGIHAVDAFMHLVGPIAEVECRSKRLTMPFDVDDTTSMLLSFENGRTGYLATIAATATLFYIRVFGTLGWAEAYGHDQLRRMGTDNKFEAKTYDGYAYPGLPTVAAELECFADAVADGTPYSVSPDEILHSVAVLQAIVESAESGKSVTVG